MRCRLTELVCFILAKLNLALESGATNISLEEIYDQFITFMIAGGEAVSVVFPSVRK